MGITGSAYLYDWCPMADDIHNAEHMYIPMNQSSDSTNELLLQQLSTVQSDMKQLTVRIENTEQKIATLTQQQAEMIDIKQLVFRIEHAEQKIAILTQQQAEMADGDMVIIRS